MCQISYYVRFNSLGIDPGDVILHTVVDVINATYLGLFTRYDDII